MELTHFLAMLPLILFLMLSLIFYGKGLVHLLTLAYALSLGFVAITLNWEFLLFMPIAIIVIISIILFSFSMVKGDWL